MVVYKLVHYSSRYATIFTLVSDKVFTCKRQKNKMKRNLVEWKFHHILGGWGRDDPEPQLFTCPYTKFPEEGLPKEEAVRKLVQCAFYYRYHGEREHLNVHYKLPTLDLIFECRGGHMPQNLWIDDEDPNDVTLPETYGESSDATIQLTYSAFRKEFNKVFEEIERMLPVDYEKGDNIRDKQLDSQSVMYIALRNVEVLHAMIRDFAEGIQYDIHKYNKEAPQRHKEESWWYRERDRAKEKFDRRYVHLKFLEEPFVAAEEEKMDDPWADEMITAFRAGLERSKDRHGDKHYRRTVRNMIEYI